MNLSSPAGTTRGVRRLVALTGLLFVMVVSSGITPGMATLPALACSCAVEPIGDLARDAAVIVEGHVARVDRPSVIRSSDQPMSYTIEVNRVWRGPTDGRPLTVETAVSGASCGLDTIDQGQQVLMVASMEHGRLTTNLCNGSGPATPDRITEVVGTFGPGQVVVPQRAPGTTGLGWIAPVAVTVVGLASMTVAIVIVITHRRRRTDTS